MKNTFIFTLSFFVYLCASNVYGNNVVRLAHGNPNPITNSSSLRTPQKIEEVYFLSKTSIAEGVERHDPHTEHKRKNFGRRKIRYMRRTSHLRKVLAKKRHIKNKQSKKNTARKTFFVSAYPIISLKVARIIKYKSL